MAQRARSPSQLSSFGQRKAFKSFLRLLEGSHALPANASAVEAASAVFSILSQRLSMGEARPLLGGGAPPLRELMPACVVDHRETLGEAIDRLECIRSVAESRRMARNRRSIIGPTARTLGRSPCNSR